jgi:hypothetical protein
MLVVLAPMGAALLGGEPASQPSASQASDPTVDWLFSQSTTGPAVATSQPAASQPAVFAAKDDDGARYAKMLMSDGEKIEGSFTSTPGQPVRIYDNAEQAYDDVPFKLIKSLEAHVLWERDQPEWKFAASGSDVKEYSGKTYPARETEYTMTLENGKTYTGAVATPLYLDGKNGVVLFVIHKRDKGEVGQTLKELVYILRLDFVGQ